MPSIWNPSRLLFVLPAVRERGPTPPPVGQPRFYTCDTTDSQRFLPGTNYGRSDCATDACAASRRSKNWPAAGVPRIFLDCLRVIPRLEPTVVARVVELERQLEKGV
jgi:hypothetical protein